MTTPPKAFISHASEDKPRFVLPFATALRANGVDAWVDEWEIGAGDSLVKRVFTEGIDESSAFVIVLSSISVTKPWVAEELDAGVVRKIAGQTKLIPVLLDEVSVPAALVHLKWLSLERLGFENLVAQSVSAIFDVSPPAPPIGNPPAYLNSTSGAKSVPEDSMVLNAYVELTLDEPNFAVSQERLHERLVGSGMSPAQIDESVKALEEDGTFQVNYYLGGNYVIAHVNPIDWLSVMEQRGVDIEIVFREVLASAVNLGTLQREQHTDEQTFASTLELMRLRGLIDYKRMGGGNYVLRNVAAKAKRLLASL
jgi:hypothetical protein